MGKGSNILMAVMLVVTVYEIIVTIRRKYKKNLKVKKNLYDKRKNSPDSFKEISKANKEYLKQIYHKDFEEAECLTISGEYNRKTEKLFIDGKRRHVTIYLVGENEIIFPMNPIQEDIHSEFIIGKHYEVDVAILKNKMYLINIRKEKTSVLNEIYEQKKQSQKGVKLEKKEEFSVFNEIIKARKKKFLRYAKISEKALFLKGAMSLALGSVMIFITIHEDKPIFPLIIFIVLLLFIVGITLPEILKKKPIYFVEGELEVVEKRNSSRVIYIGGVRVLIDKSLHDEALIGEKVTAEIAKYDMGLGLEVLKLNDKYAEQFNHFKAVFYFCLTCIYIYFAMSFRDNICEKNSYLYIALMSINFLIIIALSVKTIEKAWKSREILQ